MKTERIHRYFAAIDFGTTHIKTGVISDQGEEMMILAADTPVEHDADGFYYDPGTIAALVMHQLKEAADHYELSGVGITGMVEAGVMIDRDTKQPLSKLIPWYDRRTECYASELTKTQEKEGFWRTGLRNSFKYGVYKYRWCLDHLGYPAERTMWLSAADYLFLILTGETKTDPTYAVRTFLYDIQTGAWSKEAMQQFGVTKEQLPQVVPSGSFSGLWRLNGKEIPVAVCGHDHLCAAFGMIAGKDVIFNSCGTAETYIEVVDSLPDNEIRETSGLIYGPFVDGTSYFCMGNLSSSGQSVEWFRSLSGSEPLPYQKINELLEQAGPEPGSVYYFPYLSGVGTPSFQSGASGAFLGLRAGTTQADLIKAVIEGIGYQGRRILECGYSEGVPILCCGGAVRNSFWMQCKADITNRPVFASDRSEGTLYGAIVLLCRKNGLPMDRPNDSRDVYIPDAERVRSYQIRYQNYFLPASEWLIQTAGRFDQNSETSC